MKRLLDAVYYISRQFSPEKTQSIGMRILKANSTMTAAEVGILVGTQTSFLPINELVAAWKNTNLSAGELSAMLLASSHTVDRITSEQSIELVWTGPTTPFVATRQTEQALLQVINAAQKELFITSFVTYDIGSILSSLNFACTRGVSVSILLEDSRDQGGSVSIDGISRMQELVPKANTYAWRDKSDDFARGSVHAKVAVADQNICFITSANLTGYAMEKNMEAGVFITGGELPKLMHDHLNSLIDVNIISRV